MICLRTSLFEPKKEHDTEDMLHSISNFEEEKAEAKLKKKQKQERIAKKKSIAEEIKKREINYYENPGKYPIEKKYYPFAISDDTMKFGFTRFYIYRSKHIFKRKSSD